MTPRPIQVNSIEDVTNRKKTNKTAEDNATKIPLTKLQAEFGEIKLPFICLPKIFVIA